MLRDDSTPSYILKLRDRQPPRHVPVVPPVEKGPEGARQIAQVRQLEPCFPKPVIQATKKKKPKLTLMSRTLE